MKTGLTEGSESCYILPRSKRQGGEKNEKENVFERAGLGSHATRSLCARGHSYPYLRATHTHSQAGCAHRDAQAG